MTNSKTKNEKTMFNVYIVTVIVGLVACVAFRINDCHLYAGYSAGIAMIGGFFIFANWLLSK